VQQVTEPNVLTTVEQIMEKSLLLKEMLDNGEIGIAGGMYDIKSWHVKFFSGQRS